MRIRECEGKVFLEPSYKPSIHWNLVWRCFGKLHVAFDVFPNGIKAGLQREGAAAQHRHRLKRDFRNRTELFVGPRDQLYQDRRSVLAPFRVRSCLQLPPNIAPMGRYEIKKLLSSSGIGASHLEAIASVHHEAGLTGFVRRLHVGPRQVTATKLIVDELDESVQCLAITYVNPEVSITCPEDLRNNLSAHFIVQS